uniref:Uncharacterized protein n=1 Tax=Glossina austeni TaxID=7395 RepID=A0A1A9V1K8_GLOAU
MGDNDFDSALAESPAIASREQQRISLELFPLRLLKEKIATATHIVECSSSNLIRTYRPQKYNSTYDEMVTSHYLRPSKGFSYFEFFNEDGSSLNSDEGPSTNILYAPRISNLASEIEKIRNESCQGN